MGVFHVFKIVQMLPNRTTHHIHLLQMGFYHVSIYGIRFQWNKTVFFYHVTYLRTVHQLLNLRNSNKDAI